jgi:large subunit ribosomal protein L20
MRRSTFKKANEAVLKAGLNAYRDRKLKKRTFRSLWIVRLNAALRAQGVNYSTFIKAMNAKQMPLNRKVLSELALNEPAIFSKILKEVGVA